ncbi:armadillo-type protein [Mycena sp. CBHHK59/15]|nr:armadillo-type protein [Mycena sp. CBHHK59/15]
MQKDLVSTRSPMLDEFRASGQDRTWHLRDIAGCIVAFSGDQHGSHFIQTGMPNASSEERQTAFDETVHNNALELIQDVFGNYMSCHKLFEHGTQPQKTTPANTMEGHVFYSSCNLYGWRNFVRELEPHILRFVKDFNGNHVIQKVIERVSPDGLGFVSTFICNVFELAGRLEELLANHVPHLMQNQLGNCVIRFILEHGRPEEKALIVGQLPALGNAYSESRRALIEEIMTPAPTPHAATPIVIMMKDQYGNYVLQRLLGVTEGDQKETLVNTVRPQLLSMQRYSTAYSKHLTFN